MTNENDKTKKSLKELEERAKELEKSTKKKLESIEEDIKETLEESDREREEIVDELMTPPDEYIEKDNVCKEKNESEEIVEDLKLNSVFYDKGEFKYEKCKIVKHLNIISKIVLVLAVISAIIIAMQKQVIMNPFGGYAGYEWQPIALLYGVLSGFSGYIFYTVLNALANLVENIDKNRQLKEFELRKDMEDFDI